VQLSYGKSLSLIRLKLVPADNCANQDLARFLQGTTVNGEIVSTGPSAPDLLEFVDSRFTSGPAYLRTIQCKGSVPQSDALLSP
jgi:hypothetical protein